MSDKELDAMDGLPHLHRCLYIFGIRRYMDYATGITGVKRKISYKSLSEEIYITPHQGFEKAGNNSRDQIKRALIVLEKAGLIIRKSIVTKKEKQLILECVLAHRDESVQNKPAPMPPHSPAPQAALVDNGKNNIETNTYDSKEQESRPASRPDDFEKAARHPLSGKLNNNNKRQQFLDLFTGKNFPISYLIDARTNHMLNLWEQANITIDEALAAIKHGDTEVLSRKGRVTVPWYYQDIPFQLRQPQEISNDRLPTAQSKPRLTHDERRKRMAEWAEKKEREIEEGSESDNMAF